MEMKALTQTVMDKGFDYSSGLGILLFGLVEDSTTALIIGAGVLLLKVASDAWDKWLASRAT